MNKLGKNLVSITVKFSENKLLASVKILLNNPFKNISFILNNSLVIGKIESSKYPVKWDKTEEEKPEFRSLSQKIEVSCEHPITDLLITYCGSINDSWYNVITEEIKALSWYSVWFPQNLPFENIEDEVIIEDSEDMFVVKGTFNKGKKIWNYGGKGYEPFNIIAYKKDVLRVVSNEYINIYYIDPKIEKYANKTEQVYKDILRFYNGNLFERHKLPILDIACVSPAITVGGGYRRKDLMYCTTLGENDIELAWLLAHETAHEWCNGAAVETWEDWLNETTAEWASLLYALNNNDNDLFHFIADKKLEEINNYPPIKTIDGSRPNGVHDKGTILFYNLGQDFLVYPLQTALLQAVCCG